MPRRLEPDDYLGGQQLPTTHARHAPAADARARCVRCGARPRMTDHDNQTYLCWTCADDPRTDDEVTEATAAGADYIERRRYVIEHFGWAGGWGARV